ncbi:MAG: GTPase domain-containing protein, partial [Methyloprofundus sp.]|nr:GTPase domain-containing protein [Methyloprofundus sp.]
MSDVYKEKLELIENMYTDLDKRYSLISNLISPKVVSTERYKAFKKVVYEDFVPFINKVNVVSNEAELVMKLKGIEDQLRLVESLKRFNNKTIVAVSGGFSSGKSSFISSLFSQQDIQLPIGIEPMTSIPTYIVHADNLEQDKQSPVTGYTKTGGEVEIPLELYSQLSHEYVKEFRFNLKELLPFMVLETDIQAHPHLCFIDLPGYNPGERIGFTGQDELSASEFMTQAQCILWVISIDAGTISRDDIDFMREHIPEGAKLYVVLNKADLRPPSDIEDIINGIAGLLEVDGVEFDGISAYSSEFQQEFSFYKQSLHDVLSSWDEKRDTYKNILVELSEVFAIYKEAIVRQIEEKSEVSSKLVSLELDLHELGSFEEVDDSPQQYSSQALERRQEKIETVKETLW